MPVPIDLAAERKHGFIQIPTYAEAVVSGREGARIKSYPVFIFLDIKYDRTGPISRLNAIIPIFKGSITETNAISFIISMARTATSTAPVYQLQSKLKETFYSA